MKLFVGSLSDSIRESELKEAFLPFGTVVSATVIMDRDTGRSKGFGFVEFSSQSEALKAIEGLNGKPIGGRNVTVNEARPKEDRPRRSFDQNSRGRR